MVRDGGTSLESLGGGEALDRRVRHRIRHHLRIEWELHLPYVPNGHCGRAAWRREDRGEGTQSAILNPHAHLARDVS